MSGLPKLSSASKLYIALAVLYAAMAVFLPTNPVSRAQHQLNETTYTALLLTIRLPIVLILCFMFYAYRQLHHYSKSVAQTNEGKYFATLTHGVGWMVWGLLIAGISVSILSSIANVQESFRPIAMISSNYIYVLLTIGTFGFVSAGAHRLARDAKQQFTVKQMRWSFFALACISVVFCYLMSLRLQGDGAFDSFNAFYLPVILVWVTIVIPYIYAWSLGFYAALEIMLTAQNTAGIIYRRALQYLSAGLVILILALITLQYYRGIVPRTGGLTLGIALMFTYAIYLLMVLGSLLLIKGARRLKRIEEI